MSFQIGDLVEYRTASNVDKEKVHGFIVGFTHNDYYYVDWFGYGIDWIESYHFSSLNLLSSIK